MPGAPGPGDFGAGDPAARIPGYRLQQMNAASPRYVSPTVMAGGGVTEGGQLVLTWLPL